MSPHPDPLDDVLAAVVAEGTRRQRRRTRLLAGAGAAALAVVVLAAAVATAGSDRRPPQVAAAPRAASTTIAPPAVSGPGPDNSTPLVRFSDDAELVAFARAEALKTVTPYGVPSISPYGRERVTTLAATASEQGGAPGGSPGVPAPVQADDARRTSGSESSAVPEFSGTNNQEKDVDEADQVKTDGRRLFVQREQAVQVVDVTSGAPRVMATIPTRSEQPGGLLLAGSRLLVLTTPFDDRPKPVDQHGQWSAVGPPPAVTRVRTVDVVDPARPTVVKTADVDGGYVDARMVGGVARLVTVANPRIAWVQPNQATPESEQAALAENRRRIGASTVSSWLPAGASASTTYRTQGAAGLDTVSVRSIDPQAASVGQAVSVLAGAQVVYASLRSLYVATADAGSMLAAQDGRAVGGDLRTGIHKFDITDPAAAAYAGSGDVPGSVLNQYALSEFGDALRVATTRDRTGPAAGGGGTDSAVTVLRPSAGALVEVGSVSGLGRGERITSVRFVGDRAYVVTFRQTDPLYVVDLADPAKPKVAGELKILGFSSYLHPIGDHQLLGVGTSATDQGGVTGFQMTLFDVRDASRPRDLASVAVAGGSSQASFDPHAFLWWPAAGLAVVPLAVYDGSSVFQGAVGYGVGAGQIVERGRISHDAAGGPPIERSVVVGERLYTISGAGVLSSDLRTLKAGAFTSFG